MQKRYVAKNGIEIYGYKNPSQHGFFISLFVRAGSMYESERDSGIGHFAEHVLVRNVNKIMGGELYAELDGRGLEFNASSYSEMIQFYVSGAAANFRFGADVITKILSPIVLDRSEVDAERKRIKAEIREADDKSSLSSFTNGVVHKGTSLARSITGTLSGVDKITAKRLEEYRKAVFTKSGVFFYITGNYDEGDVEYLSSLVSECDVGEGIPCKNEAPVSENHFNRGGGVYIKNGDFTTVRFTFDLDMSKVTVPETDLIYDMLLSGYNSRFFVEMSELRGLFYDVSGAVERYRNIGELYFSYELRAREVCEAVELTVGILNEFKNTLYPESSLMKSGYVDNAYLLYDDARELNFTFAYDNHIMSLGYESLDERRRAYASVTSEDIRRAACEIFKPENLSLTVKGDKKKIDVNQIEKIIRTLK